MSDYDSDEEMPFTVGTRGYLYEPEYTKEELLQMEAEWTERERGETSEETEGQAQVRERAQATWWCRCVNCNPIPTDLESYCCHEWDLVSTQLEDISESEDSSASHTVCITNHPEFPALLNPGVLRTFFSFPKINWKKRARPEGPNDNLSSM